MKERLLKVIAIFLIVIYLATYPKVSHGVFSEIYVSTTGSDSTGTGSLDKPYATIGKAQDSVVPGSKVYVRGGTYHIKTTLNKGSGTEALPVTYSPYPGETVIIDGTGLGISEPNSLFIVYKLSYVNIVGFEMVNSGGRGISVVDSNYVSVKNNKIHDISYKGIGASGINITIDGNEIYNASMVNKNQAFKDHGWPQAVSTWLKADGSASKNINITNNYIYDSWGEGIDAIGLDGGTISGNRVKDTYSVLIYMDNARNITVNGNYVTSTNSTYFRDGYPSTGIMISSEDCCRPNPSYPSENITISNNLVVNAKYGVRYWAGDFNNSYRNLKIYYNTFKDIVNDPTIHIDNNSTSGNELKNNIIYGGVNIPNISSWSISNNNWVSGKPSADTSSSSFSANPSFVNPITNGSVDGYKLGAGSTSIGRGIPLSVTKDYFGSIRGSSPSVGFYEYGGSDGIDNDVDGDNVITFKDYFYYVTAISGGVLPANVKIDFNNNVLINNIDRNSLIEPLLLILKQ